MKYKFLRVYLFVALWFSVIGVIDSLLNFLLETTTGYQVITGLVTIAFFVYSIIMIPTFIYQKLEGFSLVLPSYHILSFIILTGLGLFFAVSQRPGFTLFLSLGLALSILEIVFTAYLLRRYNFV